MKISKKTLPISSLILHSSTTHKSFSSSSLTSILLSKLKTLLPFQSRPISQHPSSDSSIPNETPHSDDSSIKSANLRIPVSQIHQNPTFLSQSDVVETLLGLKDQPLPALNYFNLAKNQPGTYVKLESLCVLFHILSGIDVKHIKKNVRELFSTKLCPDDAATFIQCLIETAERFEFPINSRVFELLLNGFVFVNRLDDAIVCLNDMIERFGTGLESSFANLLLIILVKRYRFKEVEELLDKIHSKGIYKDVRIIGVLMECCCRRGKFEEAEQLFKKAKKMGFAIGKKTYSCAIKAVCKKPDSNAAFELLKEIRGTGLVPCISTFETTIKACVQEGNMAEAVWVKDEMVSCVKPMDLMIATSLIKGYCELGDLDSALNLFKKSIEDGLPPTRLNFVRLLKGYGNKGDIKGASELYNLMIGMGIKPRPYIHFLLIKGFLDVQSWEKACEQLKIAVEFGVINFPEYNFLMSWLCAEGKVDEARQLWDKILETGSIPTVIFDVCYTKGQKKVGLSGDMVSNGSKLNALTYNTLMMGHFKKGEVEKALQVFDEMVNQGVFCQSKTYNTVIHGLCYNGQTSQAREMLEKFTDGGNFKPSLTTYNFFVNGLIKEDKMDSALSVYTEMSEKGVSQDLLIRTDLADKLCSANNLDHALKLIRDMESKGFVLDVSAYEVLIPGFCRRGSMHIAVNLYNEFLYKGLPPSQYILKYMIRGFEVLEGNDDIEAAVSFQKKKNKKYTKNVNEEAAVVSQKKKNKKQEKNVNEKKMEQNVTYL